MHSARVSVLWNTHPNYRHNPEHHTQTHAQHKQHVQHLNSSQKSKMGALLPGPSATQLDLAKGRVVMQG